MSIEEEVIKKRLKKLKRVHPEISTEQIEKELIPLRFGEEIHPRIRKKKKKII